MSRKKAEPVTLVSKGYKKQPGRQINLRVNEELYKRFKIACIERGDTASDVVRAAIEEYLGEG